MTLEADAAKGRQSKQELTEPVRLARIGFAAVHFECRVNVASVLLDWLRCFEALRFGIEQNDCPQAGDFVVINTHVVHPQDKLVNNPLEHAAQTNLVGLLLTDVEASANAQASLAEQLVLFQRLN